MLQSLKSIGCFFENAVKVPALLTERLADPRARRRVGKRIFTDCLLVFVLYAVGGLLLWRQGVALPLWWAWLLVAADAGLVCLLELMSASPFLLRLVLAIQVGGQLCQAGLGASLKTVYIRQAVFMVAILLGLVVFYLLSHLPAWTIMWGNTVVSVLVYALLLTTPAKNGSHLAFHGIAVTELVPRTMGIISITYALTQPQKSDTQRLRNGFMILLVHCAALAIANDLAPALLLCITFLATAVLTQRSVRPLTFVCCMGGAGGCVAWSLITALHGKINLLGMIYTKVTNRVTAVFHAEQLDPAGAGYQSNQALRQLYRCNWITASDFPALHLPEADTDYVLISAARLFGLWIILAIMVGWALVLIITLLKSRNLIGFHSMLACSAALMLTAQAILNVAMCCNLFATMGVTLPLWSRGNSSLLTTGLLLSFLLAATSGVQPATAVEMTEDGIFTTEEVFE